MPEIISVNPTDPDPDIISKAAGVIKTGGIISFPTRYLYGLGADALNADAVNRVFDIKHRSHKKPILVLVKSLEDIERIVKYIPPSASSIIEKFWPGRITLVFEAKETLPVRLTAGTGRIGVRLPEHPVAVALVKSVGGPITGTSANIADAEACSRIPDLDPRITEKLDLILDAGPLKGGIGSTVVDVTGDVPKILREGAIPARALFSQ